MQLSGVVSVFVVPGFTPAGLLDPRYYWDMLVKSGPDFPLIGLEHCPRHLTADLQDQVQQLDQPQKLLCSVSKDP